MTIRSIGVFLSSHDDVDPQYAAAAEDFGRWMGRHGLTLVYGGSRAGLMERLAQAVRAEGGRVTGVVPDIVRQRGHESDACHTVIYSADLADRKAIMMREADVLVALPGGIGTLDEIFTAAAANVIGTARKRIYLPDVGDFWTPLWQMLAAMQREHMVGRRLSDFLIRTPDINRLKALLLET